MFDWFFTLLQPLEYVVATIMVAWHTVLTAIGMPTDSGGPGRSPSSGSSIVIRILLIPLFVRQIRRRAAMQLIQPEIKKIQDKYKGKSDPASRQALTQETMALYKERGTNPFSSCLPILLQSPIFFALFRVLNGIPQGKTDRAAERRAGGLGRPGHDLRGAAVRDLHARRPTCRRRSSRVILIILMSLTTFTTQRQLMTKNMPASALDNPFARQQKMLMYVLPLIFAVSGVNFPIGVLIYWLTTNLWSMGQQFYVIRRMPAPGSLAEKALLERRREKSARRGTPAEEPARQPAEPGCRGARGPASGSSRSARTARSVAAAAPRPRRASKRPGEGSARPGNSR